MHPPPFHLVVLPSYLNVMAQFIGPKQAKHIIYSVPDLYIPVYACRWVTVLGKWKTFFSGFKDQTSYTFLCFFRGTTLGFSCGVWETFPYIG